MYKCFWDDRNMMRSVLEDIIKPVCDEYGLTVMEMDLLLFFANNPECNTATDVVNLKKFTKSHVSSALKTLHEKGYVEKKYRKGNRKTIYLKITDEAKDVVEKGRTAQTKFGEVMFNGFSKEELERLVKNYGRVQDNLKGYIMNQKG